MDVNSRERPLTEVLPIPRRLLFGPPQHAAPALSPDGRHLAFLAPNDGVAGIRVGPPGGPYPPVTATRRSIAAFHWCHDSRHLLYETDEGGNEEWHLHAVDRHTGGDRDLTPFAGVQALLVATSPDRPDEVLIALNRDDPRRHDVHLLHLPTGDLSLVARDEGFGTIGGTWLADRALAVRAALRPTPDAGVEVLVRNRPDEPWRIALRGDRDDDLATRLLGVTGDGRALHLLTSAVPRNSNVGGASGAVDTAALCRLDLATGVLTVLHRDPTYDISSVFLASGDGSPRAVTVDGEHSEQRPLDPRSAAVLADVTAAAATSPSQVPGYLEIVGGDLAGRRHLVRRVSAQAAVRWYLHDEAAPRGARVQVLFDDRPGLADHALPERRPFRLTARDGLTLPGYATFPHTGRSPWPTVLLVHGGPWARDRWRCDLDAVWLADRGYLVLQVNFRGSAGYGTRFVAAGDREWGAAMHDDLIDTVVHAIKHGWSDRERVAIMGGSYGGYAALVGATQTPELFCCAIDLCGPSDLRTLLSGIPPYWDSLRALWTARVGHPEHDAELLADRSPLTRANRIPIPLFIAQGINDPRVPVREAEQLVKALQSAGVEHEYLPLPGEGHLGFELATELLLTERLERFLARHLGGRVEGSPDHDPSHLGD